MNKKSIGFWGESIVKKFLEDKGYQILETNWHHHHRELDLIVYNRKIIGIEVKTRKNQIDLAFTILKAKQVSRLRSTLKAYCLLHGQSYSKARLDLIVLRVKTPTTLGLKHYIDI
ncbi:MAG: YraN family protein [Candidatus Falkowbacteria bacterium]